MKRKQYVVLVIDHRTDVRHKLKNYFLEYLKISYAKHAKIKFCLARSVAEAIEKVEGELRIDLTIFSLDFPDEAKTPLVEMFGRYEKTAKFIAV